MTARRVLPPTMPAPTSGMDWRNRGACVGLDPELWFPIGTVGPAAAQIEEAKAVCGRCPVTAECLSWSIASRQMFGVWGGLSEQEREPLIRAAVLRSPQQRACEECSGPMDEGQLKYCGKPCQKAARSRREAQRRRDRRAGAA